MSPRKASGQGERTRAKLLDAARTVFAERGYGATRVDDVAERAGTSHGTFYLYFQNKEDVLQALAARTAAEATALAGTLEQVVRADDRRAALRRWVEAFFELHRRDWPVLQAWIHEEPSHPELDRLGRQVLADVARGLAAAIHETPGGQSLHAGIAATALIAMLERFSYFWLVRGADFDADDVLDTMTELLAGAMFSEAPARPQARARRVAPGR